jgi:hypothetical protein
MKAYVIKVFRDGRRVGRIWFTLADDSEWGEVTLFITADKELRHRLISMFWTSLTWKVLLYWLGTLDEYVFRYGKTPSEAGRGLDNVLKRSMARHNNESLTRMMYV